MKWVRVKLTMCVHAHIPFPRYAMVTREHSVKVPRKHRVEQSVEDQAKEGEIGWRHVEL